MEKVGQAKGEVTTSGCDGLESERTRTVKEPRGYEQRKLGGSP